MPRRLLIRLLPTVAAFWLPVTNSPAADFRDAADAVRFALTHNRDLRAARLAVAAAEARMQGAGRLANPEVEATLAGGQDFEGRIELGLSQRFPLTARLRLEKEISRLELEAARCEVAEREWHVALQVRQAFLELAGARAVQELRRRQTEVSAAFSESLRRRVAEGFSSALDAEEAGLETGELRAAGEEARAREAMAAGNLAALLGLPVAAPLSLRDPLDLPASLPAPRAPGGRPDVRLAEIAIEAAEKDLGLARAMRWEDIGVGLFVEAERFRDEPEGIEPEGLIGLRLSVPLPVWQSGAAAVAERQALGARRREMLEALRLAAAHQADAAWKHMQARFAAARQLQNGVLPKARQLLTDTQAAYERGEAEAQTLFRIRQRLITLETAALAARQDFHLSHADWLHAVGASNPTP